MLFKFLVLALVASLVAADEKEFVQPATSMDGHNYRDPNGYKVAFTPASLGADMKKGLKPYNPVCSIETGEGEIVVEESKGWDNWGCLVSSAAKSPFLVRVMTYQAEAKPEMDMDWDFYYVIKPGERILANPGKGSGSLRCRLCGARKYSGPLEDSNEGRNKIENLEAYSAEFQCRRECEAVIYKHRNFNAWSRTISSNEARLKQFEGITTIKVMGDGCVVDLYSEHDYAGKKLCSFKNEGDGSTVYDQDAMTENCASANCLKGHDCAKSLVIRMEKRCGTLASGSTEPPKCIKGVSCKEAGRNDLYEQSLNTANDKAATLKRLFTAMAEVLED